MTSIPNKVNKCSVVANKAGTVSEGSCLSKEYIDKLDKGYEEIKKSTGCADDHCILAYGSKIAPDETRHEKMTKFKVEGPTDTKLLSNFNIEAILRQWEEFFGFFFAYNFNMSDYEQRSWRAGEIREEPDTLATISFEQLYDPNKAVDRQGEIIKGKQFKCAGCVVNTDTYSGQGKHWMALFLDWRGSRWTAEFFNSSGRAPATPWVRWMEKKVSEMKAVARDKNLNVSSIESVRVNRRQMQQSKSECGVYSLFYIWSRINGVLPESFGQAKIPDKKMFEFRQHLFASDSFSSVNFEQLGKFDWDKFQQAHNVRWE